MYNEYAEKVKKNETDCSTFYCIRLKDTDDFICVEKYVNLNIAFRPNPFSLPCAVPLTYESQVH